MAAAFVPAITGGYLRAVDVRRFATASLIAMLAGFSWGAGIHPQSSYGDWVTYAPFLRELLPKIGVPITESSTRARSIQHHARPSGGSGDVRDSCGWSVFIRGESGVAEDCGCPGHLLFAVVQVSTLLGMPTLISPDRNAVWLMMAMSITVMTAAAKFFIARRETFRAGSDASARGSDRDRGRALVRRIPVRPGRSPGNTRGSNRLRRRPSCRARDRRMLEPSVGPWSLTGRSSRKYGAVAITCRVRPLDNTIQSTAIWPFDTLRVHRVEKRPHPFQIEAWARTSPAPTLKTAAGWCVLYPTSNRT